MTPYPDSHRKSLDDYPRPSVAVDTAVLTVAGGRLQVLLTLTNEAARSRMADRWRLPGTFLHPKEWLADAVRRSLLDKAGVSGLAPRQLEVFDDPHRDDRGWVLSVAPLQPCRRTTSRSSNARKSCPLTPTPFAAQCCPASRRQANGGKVRGKPAELYLRTQCDELTARGCETDAGRMSPAAGSL